MYSRPSRPFRDRLLVPTMGDIRFIKNTTFCAISALHQTSSSLPLHLSIHTFLHHYTTTTTKNSPIKATITMAPPPLSPAAIQARAATDTLIPRLCSLLTYTFNVYHRVFTLAQDMATHGAFLARVTDDVIAAEAVHQAQLARNQSGSEAERICHGLYYQLYQGQKDELAMKKKADKLATKWERAKEKVEWAVEAWKREMETFLGVDEEGGKREIERVEGLKEAMVEGLWEMLEPVVEELKGGMATAQ